MSLRICVDSLVHLGGGSVCAFLRTLGELRPHPGNDSCTGRRGAGGKWKLRVTAGEALASEPQRPGWTLSLLLLAE